MRYGRDELELEVVDDGRGLAADDRAARNGDSSTGGHGQVGMRERVNLFGGSLRVGPRRGGGYEVKARLPLEASSA